MYMAKYWRSPLCCVGDKACLHIQWIVLMDIASGLCNMLLLLLYYFIILMLFVVLVAIDLIVQSLKDILANSRQRSTAAEDGQGDPPPLLVKRSSDSKNARLH